YRVFLDLASAVDAVGAADAGKQEAQIVVDLSGRCHRGAGIPGRVLLTDCDRGGDAVNRVGVGLLNAFQELARVGGERFDVPALALGVDGVEGKRRLARSRYSRDHGQGVVGNLNIDILEVVDAGAANNDAICLRRIKGHRIWAETTLEPKGTRSEASRGTTESFYYKGKFSGTPEPKVSALRDAFPCYRGYW